MHLKRCSRSKFSSSRIFVLFIFVVTLKFSKCAVDTAMDLVLLTENGEEYKTNGTACPFGSYFYNEPRLIDCICSKGLWVFFQNACGRPIFIQGSEKTICTSINFEIQKSLLISDRVEPSFTAIHPRNGISVKIFLNSISVPFSLVENELIVASGEWTLLFSDGRTACIGKSNHFCIYVADQMNDDEIDSVIMGCHEFGDFPNIQLEAQQCNEFLMGGVQGGNKCMNDHRGKRDTTRIGDAKGRAYLPTSLAMNPDFVASQLNTSWSGVLPVEDEDQENVTREGNPVLKSQIWNYITERAIEVLQLYDSAPTAKEMKIPAFKFLDIAKEIMQNRCPEHYVPKSHFDMSVTAFRAVQLREILYEEVPITHKEVERILKVLNECRNKTNKPFPFIQFNRTCNESDPLDAGVIVTEKPLETVGAFNMFEQTMYLDVPYQLSPEAREPLIETVWNIYVHAHSACYPYFNRSSYNDHHKFSSVMMSLFTNGILDYWTEVTQLDPDIYSGFLGNAVVLMHRVVHCAASARLDKDETYPWDLHRPEGTRTTPPPVQNPGGGGGGTRRKRHISKYKMDKGIQAHLKCLGNIHDNAYVCKE